MKTILNEKVFDKLKEECKATGCNSYSWFKTIYMLDSIGDVNSYPRLNFIQMRTLYRQICK